MRVIILHGTGGTPEGNWFPWLKRELEQRGRAAELKVLVPHFPTPENQSLESWSGELTRAGIELEERDILVGHSIGAAFALRLLERSSGPIRSVMLVAGFASQLGDPSFDPFTESFLNRPFDWERIRKRAGSFLVLYGDDDPYVPPRFAEALGKGLGVVPQCIRGGGHLNAESGYTSFPLLADQIMKIAGVDAH